MKTKVEATENISFSQLGVVIPKGTKGNLVGESKFLGIPIYSVVFDGFKGFEELKVDGNQIKKI